MSFAHHFVCRGCNERIELPLAILQEIRSRQRSLSTGSFSQAVACPLCKHVFPYTLQSILESSTQRQDQSSDQGATSFWRVELRCDDAGCETPIRVLAPLLFGLRSDKTWPSETELATWTVHDVKCPNGHPPRLPLTNCEKEKAMSQYSSSWLNMLFKFGLVPFGASAILGILVTLGSPTDGATVARALLYTATRLVAPLVLIVVGFLSIILWQKASRFVALFFKTYISAILGMLGFTAGTMAVTLTILSHR